MLIDTLRDRRQRVYDEARTLAQKASNENRAFTRSEEEVWQELNAELDTISERIEQIAGQERRAAEVAEQFAAIDRQPLDGPPVRHPEETELSRAFASALRSRRFEPIEVPPTPGYIESRDLLKTTATQALPTSVYGRIVDLMRDSSALVRHATVLATATGETLVVPKSTGHSTSAIVAEGQPIGESDPTLAVVNLSAYKYGSLFQVSHELANDGHPDLVGFFARQAAESLVYAYGDDIVNGNGSSKPRGLLLDAAAGKTAPTGCTTTFGTQSTAGQGTDLMVGLYGSLAEGYATAPSRAWLMRGATQAALRSLKDSAGQPVIPFDASGFMGAPLDVDGFMPAQTANAESVAYGDLSRYLIRIAGGVRFERSDEFAFSSDLVTFRSLVRLDGALIDTAAVKTLTMAAS
jgi:HK97 family phage major capsid protein